MSELQPVVLSVHQAARLLGVGRSTLKRIPATELPFYRFGHRGDRRYMRDDVLGYIARRWVASEADPLRAVRYGPEDVA